MFCGVPMRVYPTLPIILLSLVLWHHQYYCFLTMSVQCEAVCIEIGHIWCYCFTIAKFYILLLVIVQPYCDWTKCKKGKSDWREKKRKTKFTKFPETQSGMHVLRKGSYQEGHSSKCFYDTSGFANVMAVFILFPNMCNLPYVVSNIYCSCLKLPYNNAIPF